MANTIVSAKVLINVPVPVMTPRLTLRPPQAFDGQALYDAKQESLEDLLPWMLWAQKEQNITSEEAFCRQKYIEFLQREDLMFFAFCGNKPVAFTGLHNIDWDLGFFEIGYWVRSSEKGKGYATEIATALARYAFQALGASRVAVEIEDGNAASEAVVKKVGFKFEGVLRNGLLNVKDEPVNKKVYAFTDLKEVPPMVVTWPEV